MALPTAQLGQMPTLQMPFYTPVTPIEKHPKAWQQALLGILTAAGGAAAKQGVENYMQPDYAPAGGQATGFTKLLQGPTINQARASELDRQSMEQAKLDENMRSERMARMLAATGQNREATARTQGLNAQIGGQISELGHMGAQEDLAAQQAATQASHEHVQDLLAQINAQRTGAVSQAQVGDIQSQMKQRDIDTRLKQTQDWIMRHQGQLPQARDMDAQGNFVQGGIGDGGVNPNVAKFAQGATPVQFDPEMSQVVKRLQQMAQPATQSVTSNVFPQSDEDAFRQQQMLARVLGTSTF